MVLQRPRLGYLRGRGEKCTNVVNIPVEGFVILLEADILTLQDINVLVLSKLVCRLILLSICQLLFLLDLTSRPTQ